MEKTEREREPDRRQRSRQPPGLDHVGVIEHGVDGMRSMASAEKPSAFLSVGAGDFPLTLAKAQVAKRPPIARRDPRLDRHDLRNGPRPIEA